MAKFLSSKQISSYMKWLDGWLVRGNCNAFRSKGLETLSNWSNRIFFQQISRKLQAFLNRDERNAYLTLSNVNAFSFGLFYQIRLLLICHYSCANCQIKYANIQSYSVNSANFANKPTICQIQGIKPIICDFFRMNPSGQIFLSP